MLVLFYLLTKKEIFTQIQQVVENVYRFLYIYLFNEIHVKETLFSVGRENYYFPWFIYNSNFGIIAVKALQYFLHARHKFVRNVPEFVSRL